VNRDFDDSELQLFRLHVSQLRKHVVLPEISWDDDVVRKPGRCVRGEDVYGECWLVANSQKQSVLSLPPADIASVAWGLFHTESATDRCYRKAVHDLLQRCSKKTLEETSSDLRTLLAASQRERLTPEVVQQLLERCQRTMRLLDRNPLTDSQRNALMDSTGPQTARKRGTTDASAFRLRERGKRNLAKIERIDELLFGDWKEWFEREAITWRAPAVRDVIWPLLKAVEQNQQVLSILRQKQREMVAWGIRLLAEQARLGPQAFPDKIAQGYHLCITGIYISPMDSDAAVDELRRAVTGGTVFYNRVAARCATLLPREEERIRYLSTLKRYLKKGGEEAEFFARYAAVYFGAVSADVERQFLTKQGMLDLQVANLDLVVAESWGNLSEDLYRESRTMGDINFLRCVLILRTLGQAYALTPSSRNLLQTMLLRAIHSTDAEVRAVAQTMRAYAGN